MRQQPGPRGFSRRNPVLQAVAGSVLTVPLAILLTSPWPAQQRHGAATMLLIRSGIGARAAHHAWRALPPGLARWRQPLLLRVAAGTATLALGGVAGAFVLVLG